MSKRWEVLTYTECGDFVNTWQEDGKPVTFDTAEEAEQEVIYHIKACQFAVSRGDMEDAPTREHFIICTVEET
jgi:hypothetical protein